MKLIQRMVVFVLISGAALVSQVSTVQCCDQFRLQSTTNGMENGCRLVGIILWCNDDNSVIDVQNWEECPWMD